MDLLLAPTRVIRLKALLTHSWRANAHKSEENGKNGCCIWSFEKILRKKRVGKMNRKMNDFASGWNEKLLGKILQKLCRGYFTAAPLSRRREITSAQSAIFFRVLIIVVLSSELWNSRSIHLPIISLYRYW